MPVGDWQFWVVTVLAVLGLAFVALPFLPRRRKRETKVELTVGRSDERTDDGDT